MGDDPKPPESLHTDADWATMIRWLQSRGKVLRIKFSGRVLLEDKRD